MPSRPPLHRPLGARSAKDQRKHDDQQRGSSTARGYGRDWQAVRLGFLQRNPLCVFCRAEGRVVAATDVDHIQSIADRPDLRLDESNLRPLCHPHHSARTATEQGFARR